MPATKKAKKPTKTKITEERVRKAPKYQSFKLSKKIPHPDGPLPSAWSIAKKSWALITANKKSLLGIALVYILLNLIFVRGFSAPLNINDIKNTIKDTFGAEPTGLSLVGVVFGSLLGGSGASTTETASLYQAILFVLVSLAIVWVFRQYSAGQKTSTKGAFYNGMYPLIPFILVIVVMLLQLLPAYIGGTVYGVVSGNNLAVSAAEKGIWIVVFGALILLSLYMVTLPNITPLQALRSSRQLVFSRRMSIFRKLLLIPFAALLLLIILVVPAIYFLPAIAPWLYFVLSLGSIVLIHAYLFSLYKELL
jgi:hypothetical protein